MKKELQFPIFRTALTASLFLGLFFAFTSETYGQAQPIRSNYIQLNGGGSVNMEHVGDPTGSATLPHNSAACGGDFRYNYGDNNKFLFFTGLPVEDPANPGGFRTPTMTEINPNDNPSANAFTVGNVTDEAVTNNGIFGNFQYHDRIHSATGASTPDGVIDGYTGTADLNGFHIIHTAQIGLNPLIDVPDMIEFMFTIVNTSSQAQVFGMSWNIDTQIGYGGDATYGDMAPYFCPGINEFRTALLSVGFPITPGGAAEQRYRTTPLTRVGWPPGPALPLGYLFITGNNPYPNDIPDYIYGLHPSCNYSGLIRTGLHNSHGYPWAKADYFAVATSDGGIADSYYYGVNNGAPQGSDNSGHILRWNPRIVLSGDTLRVGFSFGGSDAVTCCVTPIRLTDQFGAPTIFTDEDATYYTNSPFCSETIITNYSTANVPDGQGFVVLILPRAQLRPNSNMFEGPNAWWVDVELSGYDPDHDYYRWKIEYLPAYGPPDTVNPPICLDVIPQCIENVTAKYWISLDVNPDGVAEVSDPIEKSVFIPRLFCIEPNLFTIIATVNNPNFGTINPEGEITVEEGESLTYFITPNVNYIIDDVLVNGANQGKITTYTFENIQTNGMIHAIFVEDVGVNEKELANIFVYSHLNNIYIKNIETGYAQTVDILDMMGRVIYQNTLTDAETVITLNVANGIYAVRLISHGRDAACNVSTKVLISR